MCSFFLSQPSNAKDEAAQIQLEMKPTICVLSETESRCEGVFSAEWTAENNRSYSLCLFQSTSKTPIECWQNVSYGKTEFTRSIVTTTIFELRDMNNQMLLGQEIFQVINTKKKYQRSRRNPWSFF